MAVDKTGMPRTFRDYLDRRLGSLKTEYSSFRSHHMELATFIKPYRGRFFTSDRNKGHKRYNDIINSVGTKAHRTATAGMLAGSMSPARPWFSLETHDPDMMEHKPVKEWLFKVEGILRSVFNESNFYSQASTLIGEMLQFGTGCMTHVDDFNDVARFYTHTTGTYLLGANERYEIDTIAREFEWQVGQIVRRFGLENCSKQVKDAWERSNYDQWFPIIHFVEPNTNYKPHSKLSRDKAFRSIYYEKGSQGADRDKFLHVGGFDEFPAYAPRWSTTDEDVYGSDCPGMVALGDIKSLQIEEKRKAQAIDKMVNPPLGGPASLRNVNVTALPGGMNIYDGGEARQKLEAIYQVDPRLQELRADMQATEDRIKEAFFVDMFLAITTMEGIQPRNQLDLMQRNEERLLQLGPVLEHLHGELLDRLIDRTFNQCARAGILPPAPAALSGRPLRVKYISTLAMAQRAVATQNIDRLALFTGSLAQQGWQSALLKFNAEQAVDEYARAIGVPPSLVIPDEEVAKAKQLQIQAAAQEQELMDANNQAAANKTQAEADATQAQAEG